MGNESSSPSQLKDIFKSSKYSLNDSGKVVGLKDGKLGVFSDYIINIYEQINYKEIDQIKTKEKIEKIINIIELDNNDLILYCQENNGTKFPDDIIKIYKLNNGKYEYVQTITDDGNDYEEIKFRLYCRICNTIYNINDILKISDNRFITLSSLGFKIYSYSNEDSKYSYILKYQDNDYKSIERICVLNNNELIIFARDFQTAGLMAFFTSEFDKVLVDKFDIRNKTAKRIWYKKFEYASLDVSNCVILKKKFLVVRINEEFYIFDIIKGKKLMIYLPVRNKNNLGDLYSWKTESDDVFLSIKNDMINLIQFNETWNSLKVIESYRFNYINKIENLNHFYSCSSEDTEIKSIDIY